MGKIEKAIRAAQEAREAVQPGGSVRQERIRVRSRHAEPDGPMHPPVVMDVEPAVHHTLSGDDLERHRVMHPDMSDAARTSYKMLRTQVLQQAVANDWRTLAVSAVNDSAGKTLTAINLAITMAAQGSHEIYLIDLDLRNPTIAEYLGLPPNGHSLSAYLEGKATMAQCLWDVGIDHLTVVPNWEAFSNSSELVSSAMVTSLISTIRTSVRNSILIFDLPQILTADDALAMAHVVDAILLVVAEGETSRTDLAHAMELLHDMNIAGVVLNKARSR